MLSNAQVQEFQTAVWDYYHDHGRELPWRTPEPDGTYDPYNVMVSEIMLQQTQVNRVVPKYAEFIAVFPDTISLAEATLSSVLALWQGLGYNRRAKYLREAAQHLVSKDGPWKQEDLVDCKGIGPNTAAAIIVYTYNKPLIFIETNVRAVYLHHFFADQEEIHDRDILGLLEQTLDRENPREFYWAIMDYGTHLKAAIGNPNVRSKHYTKQSRFEGSARQVRGRVLRELAAMPLTMDALKKRIPDERLGSALDDLIRENLVQLKRGKLSIAD